MKLQFQANHNLGNSISKLRSWRVNDPKAESLRSFIEKHMIFRLNVYDLPKYMIPSFWNFTIISLKVNDQTDSFMYYHRAETIRSSTESMQAFTFRQWSYASSQDRSYPARIVYFKPENFGIIRTHDRILSVKKPNSRSYHPIPNFDNLVEIFDKFNRFLKHFQFRFYWVIIFE